MEILEIFSNELLPILISTKFVQFFIFSEYIELSSNSICEIFFDNFINDFENLLFINTNNLAWLFETWLFETWLFEIWLFTIEQFISEFNNIRKQYYPDDIKEDLIFPLNKIIKRLEILKNYILFLH